jgi:hypothetical protein
MGDTNHARVMVGKNYRHAISGQDPEDNAAPVCYHGVGLGHLVTQPWRRNGHAVDAMALINRAQRRIAETEPVHRATAILGDRDFIIVRSEAAVE